MSVPGNDVTGNRNGAAIINGDHRRAAICVGVAGLLHRHHQVASHGEQRRTDAWIVIHSQDAIPHTAANEWARYLDPHLDIVCINRAAKKNKRPVSIAVSHRSITLDLAAPEGDSIHQRVHHRARQIHGPARLVALIVHNGDLYAVTSTYDWTRIDRGYDPGRVYRYVGGTQWQDCGQPSDDDRTINSAISFKGKLYVGGGPATWGVFVQDGEHQWKQSHIFPKDGARRLFPHAMSRYNGKLFTAYPGAYSFDGNEWTYAGLPGPLDTNPSLQTHSLTVYRGKLCAGTWPEGKVAQYLGGEEWQQIGRVGEDGTEVNALVVYNGKLYGGSIPRAEVCRYDDAPHWTSIKRFYSPDGWQPALPGKAKSNEVKIWSRVTSLAIHEGKLFAGIGTCTSALVDTPADPADVLGKVFSIEAGKCASYDDDLGAGWKHLAGVRERGRLKLYVNGKLAAKSSSFDPADYDVSTDQPLRIGFGQTDYFSGKISEVRVYNQALTVAKIRKLSSQKPR